MLTSSGAANAAVVISDSQTRHMSCAAGICTPTEKKATLNTTDLANMLASGDVEIATGNGAVSITVMDSFSWTSTHRLTLDAQQNVSFHVPVSVAGAGAVTIATSDGIPGGQLVFFPGGSVDFWDDASSLVVNGASFTLVNDIATLASGIAAHPSGAYALAKTYNASADGTYARSPVPTAFTGTLEGLGHAIQNLSINDTAGFDTVGLFTEISADGGVRDVALTSVNLAGNDAYMGALAGQADPGATIANVSASGTVSDGSGLVSVNSGTIVDSSADVTIVNGFFDGGLVRANNGTILRCHATGSVSSAGGGGLAMYSSGTIADSYATGPVTSPSGNEFIGEGYFVGGLVGRLTGGSISGSFATGRLTAEGSGPDGRNNHSFDAVGGLVGWDEYGSIADSYATGAIVFVEGPHTKANRVGGLVGEADAPVLRSYSIGHVRATKARIGGFAGTAPSSGMSDDYWDLDTSGIRNPSRGAGSPRNDPGITGLTTTQLQSGLPAGFDPSIWAESAGINNGYPYLLANPLQ